MAETTDTLIRFLLPEAHTRGAIIKASNIIKKGAQTHGLSGMPGDMFGKSLIASILLLSVSKGGVRQVLQLDATADSHAPIRRMLAEARSGNVRGYLVWQEDRASVRNDKETGISAWMGHPMRLSTVRDLGVGQPYVSTIEHDSEFLADHVVHYLNQSVQIQADVVLHEHIGILLEAMPGCDQDHWFKAIEALASISNEMLETESPEAILTAFDSLDCKIVGQDDYRYHCGCQPETMIKVLESVPKDQLKELHDQHGEIILSCQYCKENYTFKP